MSPRSRTACLAAYVAATFLAFPHPVPGGGERVLDLGLALSWLAPACLILGLRGLAPVRAARAAGLAGWAAHTLILHWIYVVTVRYGQAPAWVGVIAPAALALYMAIHVAAFGAGLAWLDRRGRAGPLAAALLFTASEHARSFFLSGFPWATLGYAQHHNDLLLGLAGWTGVTGLSFTVALGGAGLACLVRDLRAGAGVGREAVAALAGVALLHGLGALAPSRELPPDAPRLRVAALQGNIGQGVKWSPEWADRTLAIYEELARRAAEEGARLVLWPETAVPGAIEADPELRRRLERLARETGATQVVGGVGVAPDPERQSYHYYDSAFVLGPDGRWRSRYDKSHLVPFGEYVPLRRFLGGWLGAVAAGIAPRDVSAGRGPRAFEVPLPPPSGAADRSERAGGAVRAGIPICYELLFPDLVRRFAGDGARVLLAITNDAWYGRTGAPYQFLAMTALRSAETGLWTVRAANTGVSAVIDARGRVRERSAIFERALVVADVPLPAPLPAGGAAPRTFYARHGDVFARVCWVGLLALVAAAGLRPAPGGPRAGTAEGAHRAGRGRREPASPAIEGGESR